VRRVACYHASDLLWAAVVTGVEGSASRCSHAFSISSGRFGKRTSAGRDGLYFFCVTVCHWFCSLCCGSRLAGRRPLVKQTANSWLAALKNGLDMNVAGVALAFLGAFSLRGAASASTFFAKNRWEDALRADALSDILPR